MTRQQTTAALADRAPCPEDLCAYVLSICIVYMYVQCYSTCTTFHKSKVQLHI